MQGETSQNTSSADAEKAEELSYLAAALLNLLNANEILAWQNLHDSSIAQISNMLRHLAASTQTVEQVIGQIGKGLADKNHSTLRIVILEEPLTAQTLSTIIAAITDLHTRCWFIQQNRLSDLMDYAQTRDPRYLKEANLQIGILAHNSPAIIDVIVNAGSVVGGATLVLALKKGIDAIVQAPLRFEEARLKNEREKLNQQIAAVKAEAEKRTTDQEQQFAAQKAQIDLERQQLELDRQKLQFQQERVKITLEIAKTVVSELQSISDDGQREMIIHSLVPPFLQIAATDAVILTEVPPPQSEKQKESPEEKPE
jgi:hypothetical protein